MPAHTLLIRLAGPMQSWGSQSRFDMRDTGQEPTKSGVIGLVCAALGRPRDEPVDDLAALRFGVRIDQPGTHGVDYQTAGGDRSATSGYGVAVSDGSKPRTVVSRRHYLNDAIFLIGLEGSDLDQLHTLESALASPARQLSLGRKSYVPGVPVSLPDGLRVNEPLQQALTDYPHLVSSTTQRGAGETLRLIIEDNGGDEIRHDQPVGRAFLERTFVSRRVRTGFVQPEPSGSE